MESMKHQTYQNMNQVDRIHFSLKLVSKYLTSLLLFIALLICSSLLPVMIKTVEFFTLINKNYMFLVFNGLLVFIVKNSGLITTSHQESTPSTIKETHVKTQVKEAAEVKPDQVSETKKPVHEEKSLVVVKDNEEEEDEEENNEEKNVNVVVGEEEEDELLEELHKKCEDFIRKMKEGIRYETRQLVLVQ